MFGQKSQPNKHTGPVIMKDRVESYFGLFSFQVTLFWDFSEVLQPYFPRNQILKMELSFQHSNRNTQEVHEIHIMVRGPHGPLEQINY